MLATTGFGNVDLRPDRQEGPGHRVVRAGQIDVWSEVVEREVEFEDVDSGFAEEAECSAVGVFVDQSQHVLDRYAASLGDPWRLNVSVGNRDVRIESGGRHGDR